jgi:integrase/recombinase XerD
MSIENLQHPRGEARLPEVLSKEEVQNIINATDNLKHKALLSVTYAADFIVANKENFMMKEEELYFHKTV